ncbi:MAG: ribonuclease Z [Candidatus Bathyarchaeota archaeon]|nr:ribonuclease Z [Candidatus Bathyarchaeota archaeon]
MSMKVIFLGTSGAIPTSQRGLPAVVLQRGNEQIMFDCGEGVQRQMLRAKVGFHRKLKIFITHLHGDHVLGLPGLLQTMALMDRKKAVEIYGPVGVLYFLECLQKTLQFGLTYSVKVHEFTDSGVVCDEKEYMVFAERSNHVVPSFAYAFVEKWRPGKFYPEKARALGVPEGQAWSHLQHGQKVALPDGIVVKPEDVSGPKRPGRKIVYTGDTRPFPAFAEFASEADLVIHEATFDDELTEKAELDGHSTPSQAAQAARNAKAKKLVLTHISARYSEPTVLLDQAKKFFVNTQVAEDFLELELPLTE